MGRLDALPVPGGERPRGTLAEVEAVGGGVPGGAGEIVPPILGRHVRSSNALPLGEAANVPGGTSIPVEEETESICKLGLLLTGSSCCGALDWSNLEGEWLEWCAALRETYGAPCGAPRHTSSAR